MIKYIKNFFVVIFKIVTGYYLFAGIFKLLLKKDTHTHQRTLYIKDFPFIFNEKAITRLRLVAQFIFTILLTTLIFFAILFHLMPTGAKTNYVMGSDSQNITDLGPATRVKTEILNGQKIYKQTHTMAYFKTKMPFNFDVARVRLTYKNTLPNQTISIGFQDKSIWHYDTQLFDVPFLNSLSWNRIGNKPYLYQTKPRFSSVADFLHNLPKDALIGTYDTSMDIGRVGGTQIPDYQPKSEDTTIDVPLRGRHVMYSYLKNEPFQMGIQKQDLNWYEDPDPMTVKIYKGNDLVFQAIADDDGVIDNSGKVMAPQEIEIKNPGKELPETGVYKVVIDANDDTVIKKISTNLHKIVFSGSIFPVSNERVYGSVIDSTSETTLFTNALVISTNTNHLGGLQWIRVGDYQVNINKVKDFKTFIPSEDFSKIVIPRNDVIINGYMGYFSFTEDQFFLPTSYRVIPLLAEEDLSLVDFILTDYIPAQKIGEWEVAERVFDLRTAVIKDNNLNWMIKLPNLVDGKNEVLIKSIEVTFEKKGWF